MSLLTFRNAYLSRVNARLNAVDVSNAKDTDLLIYGALFRNLDGINKIDVITLDGLRLIETLSPAELDEYALDPSSRSQVVKLFSDSALQETIVQSAGLMTSIAGSIQWLKIAEKYALSPIMQSPVAMNALAASAVARAYINTAGNSYANYARSYSTMACAKILAANAGLNPADYASLDEIRNNATAMGKVVEAPLNQNFIGTSGSIFDAFKASSVFCGKLLAAALNLSVANFADMAALCANSSAVSALIANTTALSIATSMTIALAELFKSYTIRSQFFANEAARSMLMSSQGYAYLSSIASTYICNPGASATGITKKLWLLSIYNPNGYTSGDVTFGYSTNGSSNNQSSALSLTWIQGVNNPYKITANLAAACGLVLNNSAPGTVQFIYIQMEA